MQVAVLRPGWYCVQGYSVAYIIGGLVEKLWGEPLTFKVEGSGS